MLKIQNKQTIFIAVLNLVMFKKSRAFKLCLMKVEKQESYVDEIIHVVQDKTRLYEVPIVRH